MTILVAEVGYCSHGSVRKGHGLELTLDVSDLNWFNNFNYLISHDNNFHLDFAGNIYSSMAIPGCESLAPWFLPLEMYTRNLKTDDKGKKLSFTLGA